MNDITEQDENHEERTGIMMFSHYITSMAADEHVIPLGCRCGAAIFGVSSAAAQFLWADHLEKFGVSLEPETKAEPEPVKPTRLQAMLDFLLERQSEHRENCDVCGVSDEDCTYRVHVLRQNACCGSCYSRDTHQKQDEKA